MNSYISFIIEPTMSYLPENSSHHSEIENVTMCYKFGRRKFSYVIYFQCNVLNYYKLIQEILLCKCVKLN